MDFNIDPSLGHNIVTFKKEPTPNKKGSKNLPLGTTTTRHIKPLTMHTHTHTLPTHVLCTWSKPSLCVQHTFSLLSLSFSLSLSLIVRQLGLSRGWRKEHVFRFVWFYTLLLHEFPIDKLQMCVNYNFKKSYTPPLNV